MELIDHFAEALSQHSVKRGEAGGDIGKAAARLGKSRAWGVSMLKRIREQLGAQAD